MQRPDARAAPASINLSAAEVAQLLGVKAQTVYAYASRGLLRRIGTGKQRRYAVEDVRRLQMRQRARSGHGPVAAAALSFGEPVLDTSITGLDERGPRYRGHVATALAEQGRPFEAVAELLWTGDLPSEPPVFRALPARGGAKASSLDDLMRALPSLFEVAPERQLRAPEAELPLARAVTRSLAERLVSPSERRADLSIAALLASSCRTPRAGATRALDAALIVLADHELNASSFAARVAASTDASLLACLTAALATLSGPRHGGASERVEALLEEAANLKRPADVLGRRARRGDLLPGFGHPLYPAGDPRALLLLRLASAVGARSDGARKLVIARKLARRMEQQGLPANVDFGLVALTQALGMKPGSAALLFAVGRCAGWIAHVLEQRASEAVLRPRARYVGA